MPKKLAFASKILYLCNRINPPYPRQLSTLNKPCQPVNPVNLSTKNPCQYGRNCVTLQPFWRKEPFGTGFVDTKDVL